MKISSLLIPLLNGIGAQDEVADEAPVGISTGQGGKRRQLTRYLWHNPMCRDINTCQCGGFLGSGSVKNGEITVGTATSVPDMDESNVHYDMRQSCMWHITVPKGYNLMMQFDRDFGFDVEYHNFCGFDKIHLINGHYGPNLTFDKVARFCGPRSGETGGDRPWDGKRKIFDDTGNMEFWDVPYTFENNKATVAWDSDQTQTRSGWKLKWWAVPKQGEKMMTVDTLQGALHIISQKIRPLIQDQNTVPIRVKRNQLKQLDNVMIRLEKAVSEKGPLGEKSCSDMESWEPPSDKLRSLLLEEHSLEKWLSKGGPIVSYAQYYIGRCKNYNWDQRVNNIWMKTVKNLGRARRPHFGGNLFGGPSF